MARKALSIKQFILDEWQQLKGEDEQLRRPLVVGFQSPQGSGCFHWMVRNSNPKEDLYLCHTEMESLARANPSNALLQGRGQPGTHDVQLGTEILQTIRELNKSPGLTVKFPIYDKSAFDGQGDRSPQEVTIQGPVDIILFEGWCLGYLSLSKEELQKRLDSATDTPRPAYCSYTVDDLYAISQQLKIWEREWFPMIDAMIQCTPSLTGDGDLPSLVYTWRLEAEHNMKLVRGGHGMSDEQVKAFVQRYLPSYELFFRNLRYESPWKGHTLYIEIGQDREARTIERA